MSHSHLWRCVSCNGQTADPLILQGRAGGWLVVTICRSCGKTNHHNKEANWIVEDEGMIEKTTARQGTIPPGRQGVTDADTDTNTNRIEPISHQTQQRKPPSRLDRGQGRASEDFPSESDHVDEEIIRTALRCLVEEN